MTTLYKLTDKDGVTGADYDAPLQWAAGVAHEIAADDYRGVLCDRGILHAYESPLVAVFMNPIHANYGPARLWRCETDAEVVRNDQLLCGVRRLTCVEELPLPEIKTAARVHAAIVCAWEVCDEPKWRSWATRWLSGEDRSAESAERARRAAPAWAAVWAAGVAAAAWVAEVVATERPELDLHAIIERAIKEEG